MHYPNFFSFDQMLVRRDRVSPNRFLVGFPYSKNHKIDASCVGDICLPNELGGLGLGHLVETNKALVVKLG